ncbi:MAG TPA: hypothetical protein VK501_09200 [Baekduia sp.]|uniref:hypothetical protein n=1 Tax=Baekduia sp. TaxID=2600305 RepID=UPI002CD181E6|nr:hypothetical protein [Baekduia sp.]HMJ34084.1 hypothetical protein [Baekduia sp.]
MRVAVRSFGASDFVRSRIALRKPSASKADVASSSAVPRDANTYVNAAASSTDFEVSPSALVLDDNTLTMTVAAATFGSISGLFVEWPQA